MENGPRLTPSAPRRNEEGGGTRAKSPRNAKHGWNPRATLTAGATSRRVASCRPTGYMGQLCTCTSLAPSAISSLVHLRLVHPPLVNVHLQARNLRLSITSSCSSSVREGVVSSGSLLRFTNLSLFMFRIFFFIKILRWSYLQLIGRQERERRMVKDGGWKLSEGKMG